MGVEHIYRSLDTVDKRVAHHRFVTPYTLWERNFTVDSIVPRKDDYIKQIDLRTKITGVFVGSLAMGYATNNYKGKKSDRDMWFFFETDKKSLIGLSPQLLRKRFSRGSNDISFAHIDTVININGISDIDGWAYCAARLFAPPIEYKGYPKQLMDWRLQLIHKIVLDNAYKVLWDRLVQQHTNDFVLHENASTSSHERINNFLTDALASTNLPVNERTLRILKGIRGQTHLPTYEELVNLFFES